jgi:ATP-dependent helicase HrpB
VRIVVDSGLARAPMYDEGAGFSRLRTLRISRASADQRRGRAGRTAPGAAQGGCQGGAARTALGPYPAHCKSIASCSLPPAAHARCPSQPLIPRPPPPGVCYRLWDAGDPLDESTAPEIEDADLAPLALELAAWGAPDGGPLPWLDPPDPSRLETARGLLRDLGAVDARGGVTPTGRAMAGLGVHPRFAHLVLRAREMGCGELGCVVASLLGERDVLRGGGAGPTPADIGLRLDALAGAGEHRRAWWGEDGVSSQQPGRAGARCPERPLPLRLGPPLASPFCSCRPPPQAPWPIPPARAACLRARSR